MLANTVRRALHVALVAGVLGAAAAQSAPNLLHFQARINNANGTPVNGSVAIRTAIYDVASGGTALWEETQTVTALNSVVSTVLGSTTSLPVNLFSGGDRWLGLKVGLDPEMTPRLRVVSTAFARAAADVPGGDITPNSVTVNGLPVIDASGQWVGSPTGLQGPAGPQGLQGDIGPAGPQGLQGDAGPAGPQGLQGDVGPAGPQGLQGDIGPAGPQGDVGPAGPQGLQGDIGPAGPQGLQGDVGPAGPQGLQGDVGPAGPQGLQGDVGPAGPQGLQGDVGPAGPQGLQGDVGPAGPQGDVGPAGPQGLQGDTGPAGPQGLQGDAGPQGLQGDPGLQGAQGDPGPEGPQGATGATGAAGPEGPQGPIGTNGPKLADNGGTGWGVDVAAAPQRLVATVQPAVGQSVGSLVLYGESSGVVFDAYRNDLTTGVATLLGSGTLNSVLNFADFTPTLNDYIALRVNASDPSHTVYGGHLNGTDLPTVVFTELFADAANWTFVAGPNNGTVGWAVDALPATTATASGINSWQSAPFSLNYNNGVDFNAGTNVINTGAATCNAGLIDLTGNTAATLGFLCAYSTETMTASYDKRFVEFSNDNFGSVLLSAQLAGAGNATNVNPCTATTSSAGTWHSHTVTLNPAWGAIRMRFRFDSVDGSVNTGKGWFVEDAVVSASSPLGPPGAAIQRVTAEQFQANDD